MDGVERSYGESFRPDDQLGALSIWQDMLIKTYPPETRTAVEQAIVNEYTRLIQEFAAAEGADEPVAARKAILSRLERKVDEQVRRFTGADHDEE